MIEEPIIARLQANLAPIGALDVASALGLADAFNGMATSPKLFAMSVGEDAGPNTAGTGMVSQLGWERFDIVAGFARVALGMPKLRSQVHDGIKAVLVGWLHPDGAGVVEFRGRGVLAFDPAKALLFDRLSFAFLRLVQG